MAKPPSDLTGQKFGKLTAIRPTDQRRSGSVVWECVCDCGNTVFISANSLKSGKTKSCGCLRDNRGDDLSGQKFGKLTTIRPTDQRRSGSVVWECVCDCGNTVFISANSLNSGRTKSCGCLRDNRGDDLTGQKFGRLTAIRRTDQRKSGNVVWECACDCGNIVFVGTQSLKCGNTKSCGCLRNDKADDLTGQKFGKLTAIRATDQRKGGAVVWECVCDCGNTAFISANSLKSGNTKTCGCLQKVMSPGEDLTGQKFGNLTAIRPTDQRKIRYVVWECICDCGKVFFASEYDLKRGYAKSCGCLRKGVGKATDLTGQKFGRLTAIRPTDQRRSGNIIWECVCDCGNTVFTIAQHLKSGHTKSCGCLPKGRKGRADADFEPVH